MADTKESIMLERLGLKACDLLERIHTEFSVIVRPGTLGLHLISDIPRGIKVVEVNADSQYNGIVRKGDWIRAINWECLDNATLEDFRTFLSKNQSGTQTFIVKRSCVRPVSLVTASANMVAFPYGCQNDNYVPSPPYLRVAAEIPAGPGTVKDLDENDTNQPLGIVWMGGAWTPVPSHSRKRKYKKSAKQFQKQFGQKILKKPEPMDPFNKEYRYKESAVHLATPVEREKAKQAIAAINSASGKNNDKAASLASAHLRGVTMRPSGKWQAQYYFAGKSQYIGVFDSREKAALAYEIAREHLRDKYVRDKAHAADRVNGARKAAFDGVSETHFGVDSKLSAVKVTDEKPGNNKKEGETDSTANVSVHSQTELHARERSDQDGSSDEESAEKSEVAASPIRPFVHNLMQPTGKMEEESESEEDSDSDSSELSDSEDDDFQTEVYRLERGDGVRVYTRNKRKTFEHRLKELKKFSQKHGHCIISRYTEENLSLGRWSDDTRLAYQKQKSGIKIKRKLTENEIRQLEKVGFLWILPAKEPEEPSPKASTRSLPKASSKPDSNAYNKPRNLTFEERFGALKAFSKRHGHTDITRSSKLDPSLGRWCEDTRYTYHNQHNGGTSKRRRKLTDDEIDSLENIGFKWVLVSKVKKTDGQTYVTKTPSRSTSNAVVLPARSSPSSAKLSAFDEKFHELEDFKDRYGHVDLTSQSQYNPSLGNWCFNVRQAYSKLKKGRRTNMKLSEEEIERLEDLGFKWKL